MFPLSFRRAQRSALAAALVAGLLVSAPARALGPLEWIFLDQALSRLFSPAEGSRPPSAAERQRLFAQTAQAAQSLNASLPVDLGSGIAAMRSNASAPAELEVEFLAHSTPAAQLSSEVVDQRWGTKIRSDICQSPFFKAWLSQGGSLRLTVRALGGGVVRQYFANETDCPR